MDMRDLDRTITPDIKDIKRFNIIEAHQEKLHNGIPVYVLDCSDQDIIKIDFMFPAGNWYQSEPLVAFAANNLLLEGTKHKSALEIANILDYYGVMTSCSVDKDNALFSVMALRKHLEKILPLIFEILTEPSFTETELEIFKAKHKQLFQVEQTKVRNLARVKLSQMLYGNNHPYGYSVEVEDFDKLTSQKLGDFFNHFYQLSLCKIIISGKIQRSDMELLDTTFGNIPLSQDTFINPEFILSPSADKKQLVEKADAVQSALRIGKILFNKTHPDYTGIAVLNVILGGYFGSRLMKNIREEKGYTYGISSILVSFIHSGYLTIVSEVGKDVTKEAIAEVYKEIEILRTEKVPEEELERVKNYMLGEMVRMFDGPFAQAESFSSILEYDLNYTYFYNFIEQIKAITADEILALTQKYLNPDDFTQVVAGAA